jgi:HPr kinase/phosphorylase
MSNLYQALERGYSMRVVKVEQVIDDLKLEVVNDVSVDSEVKTLEVNRCGLQFANFYDHFVYERIQIVGKNEWAYFDTLAPEQKTEIAERFMSYDMPVVIFTRDQEVFPELIEAANKYGRVIVRPPKATTTFVSRLIDYLEEKMAPTVTLHGVLVDVFGVGILILGKSGIGKSETALELVKRGHRFVADDAIEIVKTPDSTLVGKAPALIRNFLEIRGIGILDVAKLYGLASIRHSKIIDLVIQLEDWEEGKAYDRLGLEDKHVEILDTEVAAIHIPVKPGRNLAVILEAAATNHRQKSEGYNAAKELDRRLREKYQ